MTQAPALLDRFPVKDLPDRYGLKKTQEYERRKFLGIQPRKEDGAFYVSTDDLLRLDELDRHIKNGGTLASFGTFTESAELSEPPQQMLNIPVHPFAELTEHAGLLPWLAQLLPLLSRPAPPQRQRRSLDAAAVGGSLLAAQPLANLEAIDRACEKGWLLSTSHIAELLGVKAIGGKEIERYGFRFTRCGKNGREGAWRIEKLNR